MQSQMTNRIPGIYTTVKLINTEIPRIMTIIIFTQTNKNDNNKNQQNYVSSVNNNMTNKMGSRDSIRIKKSLTMTRSFFIGKAFEI
jgi:hypothetical protein